MKQLSASFRDPSGFLFKENGRLLRQVNSCYQDDYKLLIESGLYDTLTQNGLLIPHDEVQKHPGCTDLAYKVIEPKLIPFISYPYEWSFGQLRDAALTTIEIQRIALEHGMTLKDASAYNVQFLDGRPVFIDTLSFDKYKDGQPWVAYGQFCRHFMAPLALMSNRDVRLNRMMQIYLDGIPLDLTSKLLPARTFFSFSLLIHIHLHAKTQQKYAGKPQHGKKVTISKQRLQGLITGLKLAIERLQIKTQKTEWGKYYSFTNYSDDAFNHKKKIVSELLKIIKPHTVWDMGANTGVFSQIAANQGADCIAFDIDPLAVESGYQYIKKEKIENILPLQLDLTNPSPGIGWNLNERMSLIQRPLPNTALALALIHHLAISNNLPFRSIAAFFHRLCQNLIIEFVPKTDSQVQKLLASRKDVFNEYNEKDFKQSFGEYFEILGAHNISESDRTIFWLKKR